MAEKRVLIVMGVVATLVFAGLTVALARSSGPDEGSYDQVVADGKELLNELCGVTADKSGHLDAEESENGKEWIEYSHVPYDYKIVHIVEITGDYEDYELTGNVVCNYDSWYLPRAHP